MARLCRHCDTPRIETDNVGYEWEHILPQHVQTAIDANDRDALRSISQHPIRNAFYADICLGGNSRGIHGMTPGEPLHVLELGLFKLMIKGFYFNLGYKPGSKSYPKILQLLDKTYPRTLPSSEPYALYHVCLAEINWLLSPAADKKTFRLVSCRGTP